jgi:hypothetical protein
VSHRKKITDKIKLAAALLASTSLIHRRALAGLCGGDPAEIAPEGWQATAGSPGCVGARGGPGEGPGSKCGKSAVGRGDRDQPRVWHDCPTVTAIASIAGMMLRCGI